MIPSCAWSRIVSKYRTDNGSNAGLVFFSFVFFQKGSKIDSKRSAARSAALYRAVELWERWSKAKAIKQATTSAGRRRPGADASGFVWRRRRSRVGGGVGKNLKNRIPTEEGKKHTKNRQSETVALHFVVWVFIELFFSTTPNLKMIASS